ncbi:MAG: sensor histidine kinase [Bacteroidales bacterium]
MNKTMVAGEKKYLPVILHVAAWTIFIILPLYLGWVTNTADITFLKRHYLGVAGYAVLFYLSYLWLTEKYLFRGKWYLYVLFIVLLMMLLFFATDYGGERLFPRTQKELEFHKAFQEFMQSQGIPKRPDYPFRVVNYFFTALFFIGFSAGLRLLERYRTNERIRKELEKDRLQSELVMLKNQISPHFFFNTMNNIYSLIEIDTEAARNAVHRLSGLMRYLLYESEQEDVTLKKEVSFMRNYIDLMKLRLSKKVQLEINLPEPDPDRPFPPLLFVPFIENAFKHGVSYQENSFIRINLQVIGNKVVFLCENSIPGRQNTDVSDLNGIGLENVRKRLQILFPERHNLSITTSPEIYRVELQIEQ